MLTDPLTGQTFEPGSEDGERMTLRRGDELVDATAPPRGFGGRPEDAGRVRCEVRPALRPA